LVDRKPKPAIHAWILSSHGKPVAKISPVIEDDRAAAGARSALSPGSAWQLVARSRYTGGVEFEWDPGKAAKNVRKHRVSFNEAATVFGDFLGTTVADPDALSMSIDTSPSGSRAGAGC